MSKLTDIINKLNEGPITVEHPQNWMKMFGWPKAEFFEFLIKTYRESEEGKQYIGNPLTTETAPEYTERLLQWAENNLYLNENDRQKILDFINKMDEIQTDLTEEKK